LAAAYSPRRLLRRLRGQYVVGGRNTIGGLLASAFPDALEDFAEQLRLAGARRSSKILDVGTGNGDIPVRMRDAGYRDLTGVDPYLPEDAAKEPGLRMIRAELHGLRGGPCFDLVMFNHSLEHLPDPVSVLCKAREMLAPGGRILVRIPVAGCVAWKRYGTSWVQIDAPRHLFVPSREGMADLGRRAGLDLESVHDDSTEVQFLGSELYQQGLPLHELARRTGWATRRRLRREARALNQRGLGDQAGFVFSASEVVP
jgi:SAM-dependent methyltransferase